MKLKLLETTILRSPEGETGAEPAPPSMEEMRDVMAFDPFSPPAKSGAGGGEGEEGEGKPAVGAEGEAPTPEAGAAEAAPKPAPAPSPSPQPDSAKKEGEEDPLAELRATVQQFLTKKPEPPPAAVSQPQATPPAGTPKPGEAAPEKARYNISVPDPVIEAISAEEPERRRAGINALVNGIMNKIVEDFSGALVALEDKLRKDVPSQVLEHVGAQQTVARIKSDFYEAWPDLKRAADAIPGMDDTIWSTIVRAGQTAGVNEWTPEFRDQIGQMIHLSLGIPVPQGKPAAPAVPGKPAPKAVFSAGSGAGGGRPNGAAAGNEFSDVLSAGQS